MNRIYNPYFNSLRWLALCDAITSLDEYRNGNFTIQNYLPISMLGNSIAECDCTKTYEYNKDDTLSL